jgi:integrase
MPKLVNRNPKLGKNGNYAVVRYKGKTYRLGKHGTPESLKAYNRFCAELTSNPETFLMPKEPEAKITLDEVAAAYLEYAESRFFDTQYTHYEHYRVVLGFAAGIYGHLPVDELSPLKLKTIRDTMMREVQKGNPNKQRFSRNVLNQYINRIRTVISWGVENELVSVNTLHALRTVKALPKGTPGTRETKKRQAVPDDVVDRTLPFLPPVVAAIVQVQRMTARRPSEILKMRVGDIVRNRDKEGLLWHYILEHHKTERHTGNEMIIPLGKPTQELLAPYLVGKTAEQAVFSPAQAMLERNAEKRTNRKTKMTPSQAERNRRRAANPKQYCEFYDDNSYRKAIEYAIEKANRQLPPEQQIPGWSPYQLRHAAGTETSRTEGREKAQALLGHSTIETTNIYDHSDLWIREELARKQVNPFAKTDS